MATRKMTFSLPGDLAGRFVRRVPARDRSRFLSEALEKSLRDQEDALIRACLAANEDAEGKAIEIQWDQLPAEIEEPWSEAPPR